ncbi:MAG: hypothetical protein ACE5FV_08790 [Woeseia sp.]
MRNQPCRIVRLLLIIGSAVLIGSHATAQEDPCDRDSEAFYVKIKVRNNTPTEVVRGVKNADDLHVCRGDTIEWKLQNKKFFINFRDRTPFDSHEKTSRNGKITTVVSESADRGVAYKYDIGIDGGGTLDPTIIVD